MRANLRLVKRNHFHLQQNHQTQITFFEKVVKCLVFFFCFFSTLMRKAIAINRSVSCKPTQLKKVSTPICVISNVYNCYFELCWMDSVDLNFLLVKHIQLVWKFSKPVVFYPTEARRPFLPLPLPPNFYFSLLRPFPPNYRFVLNDFCIVLKMFGSWEESTVHFSDFNCR